MFNLSVVDFSDSFVRRDHKLKTTDDDCNIVTVTVVTHRVSPVYFIQNCRSFTKSFNLLV